MTVQLTEQQWSDIMREPEVPASVSDPSQNSTFVLVRAETYERFKSFFEDDSVTEQERLTQLQQFGRRAGWEDPAMNVYEDLDPRRPS